MRFLRTFMRCFWLKSLGTTGFTFVFFLAYIYLLNNPVGETTTIPRVWLDEWVAFEPLALIPYLSLWVYVSLPPIFMVRHSDIVAYGVRIGLLCLVGLLSFYVWPTAVPPADIDWARYPGMAFLKGVDAAGNACPSLHVATAVFSAIWLQRLLQAFGSPGWLKALSVLWCLAIIWSTLATRQHVALDVLAGCVLALLAGWLSIVPKRYFAVLADLPCSVRAE